MNARSVIGLLLIGLFIVICIQNVEEIPISFLFWSFTISKLLILILTFTIGIFIGMLIPIRKGKSKDISSDIKPNS